VSFDRHQGSTIASTEMLLQWLCRVPSLQPHKIILIGESAVYTADPHKNPNTTRIPLIHRDNINKVMGGASGSYGVDVTGGMASKLSLMWGLVEQIPQLQVQFIAPDADLFEKALLGHSVDSGTIMSAQ